MSHKTKATPKDRQCGNTKPVQDNRKSAISAMCAGEEKALILTICNQYVGYTAWRTSIAVYDHFSAISRMRHAAHNGAVFFDGVGLAPTHTSTDETSRRSSMVLLVGERSRSLANLLAGLPIPASDATSTAVKKCLRTYNGLGYVSPAPHKTGVGRGNPCKLKATSDAASVFFVVRYTRHSMAWCVIRQRSYNRRYVALLAYHAAHNGTICGCCVRLRPVIDAQNRISRRPIMVTLAGQPQGWPVPFSAGISTPVNVTAPIERGNSSGDSLIKLKEAVYHG
ncbi:TPA: ash family protein [Salmonella enterica subsp. diarizonae serovar 61:i:z]|nr:ash family protein [Salmonella enterica subsp. diarizonae serovar 61:i:z]